MNERIKQLADEAGAETWSRAPMRAVTGLAFTNENLQKFAELIVKECLDIVNRKEYSYHEADPLWETSQLIKLHFGVEE